AVELDIPSAELATELSDALVPDLNGDTEEFTEDDRLRYRVLKNVENELHQIVDKVDAELADATELVDTTELTDTAELVDDAGLSEEDGQAAETVTTQPAVEVYAPVFIAPEIDEPTVTEAIEVDGDETQEEDSANTVAETKESTKKRRRGGRGTSRGRGKDHKVESEEPNAASAASLAVDEQQEAAQKAVTDSGVEIIEEPKAIKGSTRIEAQRRRRAELREKGRDRKHIVSQAEFLARRESVERTMVVRDSTRDNGRGMFTQVGVLEDEMLVEHFVTSEQQQSLIGNIYLGRVQNVLPAMEAAFIDIGIGKNGVLYSGEVNWRQAGLSGRSRRIEQALKSGDQVLVQVVKDSLGHKGPRLSTQISLAGRYLVYVPGGRSAGISRKLPAPERRRLKEILERVVPGKGGAIIRTAAENVSEEAIGADVRRLHALWTDIENQAEELKAKKGAQPVAMYEEPEMLIKVIRDLFNEDFHSLVVDGRRSYAVVREYIDAVAPDLADRVIKFDREAHANADAFTAYRIEEQLHKALSRMVWLPSGGSIVIDRTEAMTVIDVNTGKFTGSGGNLEETVTQNNLEAAEEIVRQMRLRDMGGMIVVDFIDMVLPENQELVLRRLKEALGRDRTRHEVSEVTSLGLVQMTRKRLGSGLLETFATQCEACNGRGIIVHAEPVEHTEIAAGFGSIKDDRGSDSHKDNHKKDEHHRDEGSEPKHRRSHRSVVRSDNSSYQWEDKKRRRPSRLDDNALDELLAGVVIDTDDTDGTDVAVPSVQTTTPQKQSYEQALAEFESSPRRKRKTRGNSRSDHAPRPEDFRQQTSVADANVSEQHVVDEQPHEETPSETQREKRRETQKAQLKAVSRNRRRAVRRSSEPETRSKVRTRDKASRNTGGNAATNAANTTSGRQQEAAESDAQLIKIRRGRKRAVRRIASATASTRTSGNVASTASSDLERKVQDKGTSASSSGGRGRRRVARRGSVKRS
ncbi:MAG: Rne/Rng family ribonuclease, partial [Corynebacterium sp.]|nr:Rne/Rng family ribonuclease [Corynebacterium sp.]